MEIEALLDVNLSKLLTNLFTVIVSIILYIITDILVLLFISFIFSLLFSLNLYFYLKRRKREIRIKEIENGNTKYNSIEVSYNDFLNMARRGLPYSIIKLGDKYYSISSILYEDLETDKYKFICTINNKRFKSLNSLINYRFNDKKLREYNKIMIMEIDGKDPKEYY